MGKKEKKRGRPLCSLDLEKRSTPYVNSPIRFFKEGGEKRKIRPPVFKREGKKEKGDFTFCSYLLSERERRKKLRRPPCARREMTVEDIALVLVPRNLEEEKVRGGKMLFLCRTGPLKKILAQKECRRADGRVDPELGKKKERNANRPSVDRPRKKKIENERPDTFFL